MPGIYNCQHIGPGPTPHALPTAISAINYIMPANRPAPAYYAQIFNVDICVIMFMSISQNITCYAQ